MFPSVEVACGTYLLADIWMEVTIELASLFIVPGRLPEVVGVRRQERFPVRLVRGVDVLQQILHDACRRVISVALDINSVV